MIRVTSEADKICVAKANEAAQGHIFADWDELSPEAQRALIAQVHRIDFPLVKRLSEQVQRGLGSAAPRPLYRPAPLTYGPDPRTQKDEHGLCLSLGEYALRSGEVEVLTLSRLPRPCLEEGESPLLLPVGPVTGKSLLELHAERIHALNRRHRTSLRWTIVCPASEKAVLYQAFKASNYFGLPPSDVFFEEEPVLPVLDRRGKVLFSAPGHIALRSTGPAEVVERWIAEDRLEGQVAPRTRYLLCFEAGNALAGFADPVFLGQHVRDRREVSVKVIAREAPGEPGHVLCGVNETCGTLDTTTLAPEDLEARAQDGSLVLCTMTTGTMVFSVEFLRRLRREGITAPPRPVPEATPCLSKRGQTLRPVEPNSYRFFSHLQDLIWHAEAPLLRVVDRAAEHSPLEMRGGPERSPLSAQRDLSRAHASWLRSVQPGLAPAYGTDAGPAVEISPLLALSAEELAERLTSPVDADGNILLGPGA